MRKELRLCRVILISTLIFALLLGLSVVFQNSTNNVSAMELTHFSNIAGGEIQEQDLIDAGNITGRKLTITPSEAGGKVTFEYDGVFSVTDKMDGVKDIFSITINDMASLANKKFSIIAVTMEDMVNPEEQIVYSLGQYGIGGNNFELFTTRIGFSDKGLSEISMYSGLYSEYGDMGYVYHTAIDNNISPGGYHLSGNYVAGDIRTFFIRYNNTTGSRNISLYPNMNEHYLNNIDNQQVYHEGEYKTLDLPELFTSGYYKLKFQILGAQEGLSFTLNGDMDASTVPFFKNTSYAFSVIEGNSLEQDLKKNVLSKCVGAMKELSTSSVTLTDGSNNPVDFDQVVKSETPYVFYATVTSNGLTSNKVQYSVTVFEKYILYNNYSVEVQDGEVPFPVVERLPEGFTYSVKLYPAESSTPEVLIAEGLTYEFTDVGTYRVVYEIYDVELNLHNADDLFFAVLTVVDTTAPEIAFSESYLAEYNIGEEITIKEPSIKDNNLSGQPTWAVKAYLESDEIPVTNGKISLNATGAYRIVYTFSDKSDNEDSLEVRFIVVENDTEKPTITLSGNYLDKYSKGEKIQILQASVTDNVDVGLTANVEVLLNGVAVEVKDGYVLPEEEGLLLITYFVSDAADNTETLIIRIEITNGNGLGVLGITLIAVGSVLVAATVVTIVIIKKRKNK